MNQQLYVILYSKYSQNSNNLIKFIQSSPVDLTTTIGLNPICIDNEKIRQRIMNCKEVQIHSVPTILVVYPTGGVEKYEGITAFNWVEETVKSLLPPPPPPPPPLPVRQPVQQEIIPEEEEEEEEEHIKIPKPKPKRPKNPLKEGNIIDLDKLDNKEEETEQEEQVSEEVQNTIKSSSLMAQAMAMQKERESS